MRRGLLAESSDAQEQSYQHFEMFLRGHQIDILTPRHALFRSSVAQIQQNMGTFNRPQNMSRRVVEFETNHDHTRLMGYSVDFECFTRPSGTISIFLLIANSVEVFVTARKEPDGALG